MNFHIRNINPLSLIVGIAFIILLLAGMFFVAQGVYLILMYLSPVLLIAAILLDYKVILSYGKWLINKFKSNAISGVTWTLLTVFGFPFVSALLCFRAWASYSTKGLSGNEKENEGEYVEYEIVEDEEPLEIADHYKTN